MSTKLQKQPRWIERALQGITHWMGHRRCLYRDYPLSEGALVAEVCNLIYANLPQTHQLLCEVQYSSLVSCHPVPGPLQGRIRADLVVARKAAQRHVDPVPEFIIEVKRASAPRNLIDADILRLAVLRRHHPDIRAFVFVISEAERPKRFVNAAGHSIRGIHLISGEDEYFRVRRTWKAAHAFTKRDRAQYACLLEIYPASKKTGGRRNRKNNPARVQQVAERS
ncbi:MAG TPA: hypothetical protein VMU48_20555 [Terracidiphilus sp.]|nr:hypothetical protein [Terracidiphilus sp.]